MLKYSISITYLFTPPFYACFSIPTSTHQFKKPYILTFFNTYLYSFPFLICSFDFSPILARIRRLYLRLYFTITFS